MKTKSRVPSHYKEGTSDWDTEYNMLLEDGRTCAECGHSKTCKKVYGVEDGKEGTQYYENTAVDPENVSAALSQIQQWVSAQAITAGLKARGLGLG